ncbi:MAG: hypothetical protein JNL43_12975 [Flavobacteriales bacterium]|nr:hypothetical protein [Flavobacteriales bacterium]
MNMEHQLIDTRSAVLERVSDGLIELRFKPDVKLDVEGMTQIVLAKRQLGSPGTDVLAILPPELDFDLDVLTIDHDEVNGGCGNVERMAFATQSSFNERLTKIYFRYHPRPYPTGVFLSEADARKWLATKLPEPSAS